MLDLDGDSDLDLMTCEEVHDLGVFWYENPTVGEAKPAPGVPARP